MIISGRTILIVEDEPIIAFGLEDLLDSAGAESLTAGSLEEAEQALATTQVDAAILDVNVNGENSYALAARLVERGLPFIFATGYGEALHPQDLAAVPTISKPYSLKDITSAFAALAAD